MTKANIRTKLPSDGHGLSPQLADDYYEARAKGNQLPELFVVARLASVGHGEDEGKRTHTWGFEQIEIVREDDDRLATVQALLDDAQERRIGHRQLPLGFDSRNDDEQRRDLLALVDEWASEQGLTAADVAERWRTQWGIDGESPATDGSFAHPDINKAAVHHIKEFAYMVGVLADAPEASPDDSDTNDDEDEDELAAATS